MKKKVENSFSTFYKDFPRSFSIHLRHPPMAYKRSSKKTGKNSRRTTTLNSNGSRTVSNSRRNSSGNRKTISHNSKTGRTRTTYSVRNNGGWITKFTSMSGSTGSVNYFSKKHRSTRSKKHASETTRRNSGYFYVADDDMSWSGIFKLWLQIILMYILFGVFCITLVVVTALMLGWIF